MTKCVPVESNKYTALNAAFWSGSAFLYIPKGVEIEQPILSQIWFDSPASATFAHTLIIAEEQSTVRFLAEYNSASEHERPPFFNDIVEPYAQTEVRVDSCKMQDLEQNVWNVTTQNATLA